MKTGEVFSGSVKKILLHRARRWGGLFLNIGSFKSDKFHLDKLKLVCVERRDNSSGKWNTCAIIEIENNANFFRLNLPINKSK